MKCVLAVPSDDRTKLLAASAMLTNGKTPSILLYAVSAKRSFLYFYFARLIGADVGAASEESPVFAEH